MPDPSILKVNEIFWSFQGEGQRSGFPSIFVRLAGCQLRCPYCDTRQAWDENNSEPMTVKEIVKCVENHRKRFPRSQVVLTGGEPLGQDVSALVKELKAGDFFVCVETDGLHFQEVPIDWWSVSPKDGSGFTIHENLVGLNKISEIKLVVTGKLAVANIKKIRDMVAGVPIYLQPDAFDKKRYKRTFQLFQRCQEEGLGNVRCGIQLHKVYGVR